jgi:hypothetical protein
VNIASRLLLVAALLFAQAIGVAHEITHGPSLAAHAEGDGKTPKNNPLCDFHTALASVVGAISGSAAPLEVAAAAQCVFIAADAPSARFAAFAPQSRAPPARL